MKLEDARHLFPNAQEALRYRVVKAVEDGMSKLEAGRVFNISRTALHHWTKAVAEQRVKGLKAKKQERLRRSRLAPYQAAMTVRLMTKNGSDQLGLPFSLWTREGVRAGC